MSLNYEEFLLNGISDTIVKVTAKARHITVTGAKGTITKNLSHLGIDIRVMDMTKVTS
jgi:ribosomal protein L6P/L9E